ncbi:MAG: hypothetical protein ABI999_15090 [Acidobacteriota bacterium]
MSILNTEEIEDSSPSPFNWLGVVAVVVACELLERRGGGNGILTSIPDRPISGLIGAAIFYSFMLGIPALWVSRFGKDSSWRQVWGVVFFGAWLVWTVILLVIVVAAFMLLGRP